MDNDKILDEIKGYLTCIAMLLGWFVLFFVIL